MINTPMDIASLPPILRPVKIISFDNAFPNNLGSLTVPPALVKAKNPLKDNHSTFFERE